MALLTGVKRPWCFLIWKLPASEAMKGTIIKEIKQKLIQENENLKMSLAAAEKRMQNTLKSKAKLGCENTDLKEQLKVLQRTLEDLGEQLYTANRDYDKLLQTREREQQANGNLKSENAIIKASLASAEVRFRNAQESNEKLESENSDLKDQVERLKETMMKTGEDLQDKQSMLDKVLKEREQEQQEYTNLKSVYEDVKVTLTTAKERHKSSLESIMSENSDFKDQLHISQCTIEDMREQLHSVKGDYNKLFQTLEHEEQANATLKSENEDNKASLASAEVRFRNAQESNEKLESENSDLKEQVERLKETMMKTGEDLQDKQSMLDKVLKEREQKQQDYTNLKSAYEDVKVSLASVEVRFRDAQESNEKLESENSDLKEQVERLKETMMKTGEDLQDKQSMLDKVLKEREEAQEDFTNLKSAYEDMKVSLTTAEETVKNALESQRKLESKNSDLKHQVVQLHQTVDEMEEQLQDKQMAHDEMILMELNKKKAAFRKLRSSYIILKNSFDSTSKLESENFDLKEQVDQLQKSLQKMGDDLHNKQMTNNEVKEELETTKADMTLTSEYEDMKVSLFSIDENIQNALECKTKLESENAILREQIESVQESVQEVEVNHETLKQKKGLLASRAQFNKHEYHDSDLEQICLPLLKLNLCRK